MRIHSNTLTTQDFHDAAKAAGVAVVDLTEHGSRSRARAFNFTLTGSGSYRSQWASSDHKAATWDEWGIVFAALFDVDPAAFAGSKSWGYEGRANFHWRTGDRFRTLTPSRQHKRHKWHGYGTVVTGSYAVAECDCGALHRWMMPGHQWSDIAS